MAIAARAAGSWENGATGLTADEVVAVPAAQVTGDLMLLLAAWKDYSITAQVAGWTELVEWADGAVATGNGLGSMKVGCWYKEATSDTESDPTLDFSTTTNLLGEATIVVFSKAATEMWNTPTYVTAAHTTWTTSSQTTNASSTTTIPAGACVVGVASVRDDTATFTRPTTGVSAVSGVTWNGNYVEYPATHASTTTGNDMAVDAGYRLVTSGGAGITLTQTATLSAADTGSLLWVVLSVITGTKAPAGVASGTGNAPQPAGNPGAMSTVAAGVGAAQWGGAASSAHVQNLGTNRSTASGQSSLALSPASKTVSVGNTIVVGWGAYDAGVASGVTDNLGNTYSPIEAVSGAQARSGLWSAPVTTGGSITTITVAFGTNANYPWMTAAEFSGLAGSPAVGSGVYQSATAGKWAASKTIPANGMAVGLASNANPDTITAGSASGSPSTSIALSVFWNGDSYMSGALAYAGAGDSQVTAFDGTVYLGGATRNTAGAGGIFSPAGGGITGATASVGGAPAAAEGTGTSPQPTVATTGGGTSAPAEVASGAGTAPTPAAHLWATAALASGTGSVPTATANPGAIAPAVAGSGAAPQPAVQVRATAGASAGTGTVPTTTASLGAMPPATTGAGTVPQARANPGAIAPAASGSGTVPTSTASLGAVPTAGTGTGTAPQPTVSAFPAKDASAGLASGTGTAPAPLPAIAAFPAAGAGTGSAPQPSVTTTGATAANAGAATGTGDAPLAWVGIRATAGLGSATGTAPTATANPGAAPAAGPGTGTAPQSAIHVRIPADVGAGTGTAPVPTVTTAGTTNAPAQLAAGTGTAPQPSAVGTPFTVAQALAAAGTGAAWGPTPSLGLMAQVAAAIGAANVATGWAQEGVSVYAGWAHGTGTAWPVRAGSTGGAPPMAMAGHDTPRGTASAPTPDGRAASLAPRGTASNPVPTGTASDSIPEA